MKMSSGNVVNPEADNRVKYKLDDEKLASAVKEVGVEKESDLHPGSKSGAAAKITLGVLILLKQINRTFSST